MYLLLRNGVVMDSKKEISKLNNHIKNLETEIHVLHETIDYLTKKLYGRSSEKTATLTDVNDDQVSLFDEVETSADEKAAEPDLKEVQNYRRKKFKGQRAELLKDLPRRKRLCTLAEEDQFCETCGHDLVSIGEEFVRTEIQFIPAKIEVIDYYRASYECRSCRKNNRPYIENSPMPYPVIQHSMASPSTVAWVAHQKFVNAMPLYRQEKEWQMVGVKLSRATMSNWLMVATRDWLMPILDLMHQRLLEHTHLHADETPIQVLKEPDRKNTTKSYMWVYGTGKNSSEPIRIFQYQPGRQAQHPEKFLKGFKGYLHTDAYSGYNKIPNVVRCMCWAHLRRKFVDALPKNVKDPSETLAGQGIEYCNQLFKIEKDLEALECKEERKAKRLELEQPILDAFWSWIDDTLASNTILPKEKLAKAINYAQNHRQEFMNYLEDGDCVISNNQAENSIRPFTIGRKNWLFSGSPKGAETSAALYSIIETAKANGLVPFKYLEFIFKELPGVQFHRHPEFLEEFLPWSEEVQQFCK